MTNSIIRKSATNGIYLENATLVTFENNTIEQCNDYPVSLPANSVHKIAANNQISGKGVLINNGNFYNQTVTWNKLTVPYHIDGMFIYDDGELTLSAGISMLFKGAGFLSVGNSSYGKLIANGTVNEPIIFSSAASSPSAGDWRGLEFMEYITNGTILNNCKVLYGGKDDGYGANVYSYGNGSKLTVTNSEIGYSITCGFHAEDCSPIISGIVYTQNSSDFIND
jgi:large repetitive protein